MPEVRFSGFVHYLCKVVGWQLGKWDLGGNILACEHKAIYCKGLGEGIILEIFSGAEFCCAGLVWFCFEQKETKGTEGV